MSTNNNWLKELFINEAKPALDRYGVGDSEGLYDVGYQDGHEAGLVEGIQSEYDKLWDAFQVNGKRTDYEAAFNRGWTDDTFKPKYDIVVTYASRMFQYTPITDLVNKLESVGVVLDTSKCDNMIQMFQGAAVKRVPALDLCKATATGYAFAQTDHMDAIDKLIVSENTIFSNSTFTNNNNLKNITFEGIISTSINLQWSPLYTDSMKSVITHLKNYSGSDSAYTCTVKFSDTCWAALEADGTTAPDGSSWREYVESTLCWLT